MFKEFKMYCLRERRECLEKTYFYDTMTELMGDSIKIPRTKEFSKCHRCDTLIEQIRKSRNSQRREQLEILYQLHQLWQANERRRYYRHATKAYRFPKKYLSMIIDGMDQLKTALMSLGRDTSDTAKLTKLHIALTGVLSHGHAPFSFAYTTVGDFPKDSSFTTHIILKHLKKIRAQTLANHWPKVFYLQVDNTTRENKNSTILALCRLLITEGIFEKVS